MITLKDIYKLSKADIQAGETQGQTWHCTDVCTVSGNETIIHLHNAATGESVRTRITLEV